MKRKLHSYLDLPPLAGVCAFEEAERIGYSVEENVRLLKRYHYALKRSFEILLSRIPSIPIYELKMGLSYHSYLLTENISVLRKRISEMREPPLGLDEVPDNSLEIFFDEIRNVEDPMEMFVGVYWVALPSFFSAIEKHLAETNILVDHPTVRLLRHLKADLLDIIPWGKACLEKWQLHFQNEPEFKKWQKIFLCYLTAAGDIHGKSKKPSRLPARNRSTKPFVFQKVPYRDERFPDPFNMGVSGMGFLQNKTFPPEAKNLMLLFKRIREIDVPEMMASIIMETPDKPWDYYREMTRQLWDEARHAMMGEVGLAHHGIDWTKACIPHIWSYELNTLLTPLQRHAILHSIEQGLMAKTGKRFEWEIATASGDRLSATFHDYDWADEVLHAQTGRNWYVPNFKNNAEANEKSNEAYEMIRKSRPDYRAMGLTQHENWWPRFYQHACKVLGMEYDERVANYNTSEFSNGDPQDARVDSG